MGSVDRLNVRDGKEIRNAMEPGEGREMGGGVKRRDRGKEKGVTW